MTIRSTVFMLAAAVALLPFAPRDARAAAATTATATRPAADAWPRVPAVDWSKIKLDDFTDDELDLPYFLHHFHTVANAVIEAGSNRGFMSLGVWRGRDKNQQGTHNARVMESHLSLAFFYCTKRPWNPYFGSPAVRPRLEAMLTFWCNLQNDDGRFSEYGPKQWNLPATAFATKFMGQTLTLLRRAGDEAPIDPALHKKLIDADRKAIVAVLTMDDLYRHGKSFTNQYLNVFAGAAAYLDLVPDDNEVRDLMQKKFDDADRDFLSPCGYYYEADGPDFGYTLHTTHSDIEMTYFYFRGKPIGDTLERQETKWNDWLAYNLLRQPDGSTFALNRGVQTRQNQADWPRQDGRLCERVTNGRAFATSREEFEESARQQRKELAATWGKFPDVPIGQPGYSFSPYNFLHRDHTPYYPTAAGRDAATAALPYLARDRFTHQCTDSRKPVTFTYIRRPSYYAAFNTGAHLTSQQRLGLGIIWHPAAGTLLQSQSESSDHAWGTRAAGEKNVYEAADIPATFAIDDKPVAPDVGNHDLPGAGVLVIRYPLGKTGQKSVTFTDDGIEVKIEHPGAFTEQVPLLEVGENAPIRLIASRETSVRDEPGPSVFLSHTRIVTRMISATDSLDYRIRITP